MKSLFQYGTYGFLSALMATEIAIAPRVFAGNAGDAADKAKVDATKSSRSARRDLKKAGGKVTGQKNSYDDAKEGVKDGANNVKDEAQYQARKLKRKTK